MLKIQKFDLLVSFYTFCIVAAEVFAAKTFSLGELGNLKLNASVSILVVPLIFTITDIVTEVYGKERSRSMIRSGLVIIAMLLIFSLIAVHLPPSARFAGSEAAYDDVFSKSARISAASLVAFATAEFLDVYIFQRIREKLGKKALWLRNNASNFVAQLIDTTLFITLAFYSLAKPLQDNLPFLISLIIPYWLLKCCLSVLETPFVYLGVRWLKSDKNPKAKSAA